ncbi:MAG: GDP-mannose 4,6-dehydratase [Candidatus Colwellbacteria bacterium]|nr:GDP-mannose 4,6-dehydratase [Candidatus Colwellbacteria bacterium]
MKKALITGATGQDGSYLIELLLDKGYEVHGVVRRASSSNTSRIDHLYQDPHINGVNFHLHYGDLADGNAIRKLIYKIQPDEIYNLGAQSDVEISFKIPEYTLDVTGVGTLRLLEAIREFEVQTGKKVKFYQASSSEMFGNSPAPQHEKTAFNPRSPYGAAKVLAHDITKNYREAYGLFAVSGILFNHESPRRGENFVTRKITRGVARIKAGLDKKLYLGNLDAKRDWGYAPEYMEAAWLMLQQPEPDDYVIGTGESRSVKEFVGEAFKHAGMPDWQNYAEVNDPRYLRPSEVHYLQADPRKAKEKFGWTAKTKWNDLVKIMVDHDLKEYGII